MILTTERIATVSKAELPAIVAELARLQNLAVERVLAPDPPEPEDRLLTVEQAAVRLGMTPVALIRRRDLPFRRMVGSRTVRFSERGIEKFLRRV